MKQTKKYAGACQIATLPHTSQEQLYQELNRLGFFWNQKAQIWERNDRLAEPPSGILKIRVTTASNKIEQLADIAIEAMQQYGLNLLERSQPYICRPPKQAESRIYLSFIDDEK